MSYQRDFDIRVSVAMVGGGSHAYRNLLPAMNFLPVDLKAICVKSDMVRAERTAAQYGCRAYTDRDRMFTEVDFDAVVVCLPPAIQAEVGAEILDRGKHVWLEKPPGLTGSEVEKLIEKRGDRIAMVGFKKAFMPVTDKAREICSSAAYSGLNSMLALYPIRIIRSEVSRNERGEPAAWMVSGVHPVSFLLAVGGKAVSVRTVCGQTGYGLCCIRFESGVIGNIHLASGASPMETYCLYGDGWHLEIYNNIRVSLHRGVPLKYGRSTSFVPSGEDSGAVVWEAANSQARLENKALFTQGIYGALKEFFDCVIENRRPRCGSLEFALDVMRVCEAAMRSDGSEVMLH